MPHPLEGLRVLEIGTFVSAPYCGKLFAGYGAEVIKIEPPGGDISRAHGPFKDGVPNPETSSLFLYLNTGKKSVELDITQPEGRAAFLKLAETADVVIENYKPSEIRALGLDYEALSAVNHRLVVISITTFGQYGPYGEFESNNLIAIATGGQMFITGTQDGGPLKNGGYQADYQPSGGATVSVHAECRDTDDPPTWRVTGFFPTNGGGCQPLGCPASRQQDSKGTRPVPQNSSGRIW